MSMATPSVGASLQKLNITSCDLLNCESNPTSGGMTSVAMVTNGVVLDLYDFMCRHCECTYLSLTKWLSCLYGDKWPKESPTVKSITQSVKRLSARKDKIKKSPNSAAKDEKMLDFLNEEYTLPAVFKVKGKIYKASPVQLRHCKECHSDTEVKTLKAVNVDLCKELSELQLENELRKDANGEIQMLREKMHSLHRNTSKKLGRRDNAISEMSERIDEQETELGKLQKKVSQLESQLRKVKQDKERLRHRAEYWKTKSYQIKSSSEEQEVQEIIDKQEEIDHLKGGVHYLEERNIELQEKVNELMSTDDEIQTFAKGKFNDDVRACCYELLSLNVGIRNVAPVIRSVMRNLTHQSVDRLPSNTALCRMMLECLTLAEAQLGEKLAQSDQNNYTIQTDGTTKYGQHFATFDIATVDTTYTLGLRQVFSGSAQNTLDTLMEILEDLDMVQKHLNGSKVSSLIVAKIKNTMSDRHAAEKLFNELLADYRSEVLPDIVSGWEEATETEKEQLTRMNNFFCGLHFLVGLADCAEATLKLWEAMYDLPASGKSSGTQRLIRTTCKAFHARGSQQAGCSVQFQAYLRNKAIDKIPLAAFRGNRFNIIFYDAAGVYFLKAHMQDYLNTVHGSLNLLLKAVLSDLRVPQYIAGCKALGIIDKFVTGPLWRHLRLSTTSVLNMSVVYTTLKLKFEEWGQDAQAVMEGRDRLLPEHVGEDEVTKMLLTSTENDPMVQELLQLLFKSFVLTVQRLLIDHLPGGAYHSVSDTAIAEEVKSVPTTNVSPERDFAALDRVLSEKPNATHIALESLLLYSHNRTSDWLQSKSTEEREKLFKVARELSSVQKRNFLKRRGEIIEKRKAAVLRKEQETIEKREKEVRIKEALTKQIQKVGLWTSRSEVEEGLRKLKTVTSKRDALKLQINFRRKVLGQIHTDKDVFVFSRKGKQHTPVQLTQNLMKLLPSEQEPQQPLDAEIFAENPELLVNKRIDHLFETENGPRWYRGSVLGYLKDSREYKVLYDGEEDEFIYPLLEDIAMGELFVYDQ